MSVTDFFVRMSKMHRIIVLCEEPKRYSELKRALEISDAGLAKHLKSLQKLGWIKKKDDGWYELTVSGRGILPQAQRVASALEKFKVFPPWINGMTTHYFGMQGDDGRAMLDKVNRLTNAYRKKHPQKAFVLSVIYKGEPPMSAG